MAECYEVQRNAIVQVPVIGSALQLCILGTGVFCQPLGEMDRVCIRTETEEVKMRYPTKGTTSIFLVNKSHSCGTVT